MKYFKSPLTVVKYLTRYRGRSCPMRAMQRSIVSKAFLFLYVKLIVSQSVLVSSILEMIIPLDDDILVYVLITWSGLMFTIPVVLQSPTSRCMVVYKLQQVCASESLVVSLMDLLCLLKCIIT